MPEQQKRENRIENCLPIARNGILQSLSTITIDDRSCLVSQSHRGAPELFSLLRHPEELLGPLGRIPGIMFFVKDAAYRYVAMSGGVHESIGLVPDENPIGRTDFDLFPPLVAEAFRRNDRQVIEKGRTLLDELHVVGTRGGQSKLVYSSKWPLHDHHGRIVGLVGTNRRVEAADSAALGEDGRLLPAIHRMIEEPAAPHSIEALARECGLSSSHFMRLFRRSMRVTAGRFLEQVRISRASDLLRSSRIPIADIARSCGFYDHSAFVKRFRLHTGVTPLAYRKSGHARIGGSLATVEHELTDSV